MKENEVIIDDPLKVDPKVKIQKDIQEAYGIISDLEHWLSSIYNVSTRKMRKPKLRKKMTKVKKDIQKLHKIIETGRGMLDIYDNQGG